MWLSNLWDMFFGYIHDAFPNTLIYELVALSHAKKN
jgi:hypothetical protein